MTRAKQNTEQTRAVSVAKASVKKNSIKQKTADELADIYKNQPKDIKRPSTKIAEADTKAKKEDKIDQEGGQRKRQRNKARHE